MQAGAAGAAEPRRITSVSELGRVAELAGLDSGAARRVAEALRTAQILNRNRTLAFTHPLIAEAVYRHCTDGAERFELHTKAAELLLRDGRGAALAATHLQGLEACGDPWVCEVLLKAAREYLRIGAPEEAARVLRRAIDEPAPPGQRAELYAELGRATFLYAPEDSIAPFEQALEADRNDRRLRHPIIINLARAYGFNDRLRQAVELLQDEAAAVGVSKLRRRFLAEHYMWAAFWTEDRGFLDRARTLSRMIGHTRHFDDRASRSLSAVHGWYTVLRGHPSSTAVKHAGQALGAVDDSDDWEGMSWCEEDWGFEIPMMIVLTYIYSDQFMKAEKLLKEGQRELRENGRQGTHMSYCHAFFAMLYHRWGRLEEAHRHAEEALFLSEKLGQAPPARWYAAGILIQVLIARGEVEKAQKLHDRTDFTRGSAQARVFPVPQIVCAELHLAAGRPQKAIPFLEELRDLLEAAGMDNPAWCPWEILLAQAYREAGYRTEARRTALSAERRAMWFGAPVTIGQACRVSGTVMEKQAGLTRFETALILLNDVGSRYEHALTMFEYGMRLRSIDDFFEAAHVFVQAMEEAQACGARALVRRVELALQAVLEVTGPAKPEGHSVFDAPGLLGDAPWTSEELSDGLSDGLSEELSEGFGGSEGHGIAPFDPPDDPGAPGHDGPPAPGW